MGFLRGVPLFFLALGLGCSDDANVGADAGVLPDDGCAQEDCLCVTKAECPAHADCIAGDGQSACECVAGYELIGEFCVFAGLQDPDLNGDPAAWMLSGTVSIDPAATDTLMFDDGEALWLPADFFALEHIKQPFEIGANEDAEPLVAVVHQRVDSEYSGDIYTWLAPDALFRMGPQQSRLPITAVNAWQESRVCLGDGVYGRPLEVEVTPGSVPELAGWRDYYTAVHVDSVQIEPAGQGECPMSGQVVAGNFESLGWTMQGDFLVTKEVRPVGVGGSNAGYLEVTTCNSYASMKTTASIPEKTTGQALQFAWSASQGAEVNVGLGFSEHSRFTKLIVGTETSWIGSLEGSGGNLQSTRVCIPPHRFGTVAPVEFAMRKDWQGDDCGAGPRSFRIDEVEIVDDPACPSTGSGVDLGFEMVENVVASGWSLFTDADRSATIENVGVMEAAEGRHVLRLLSNPANARTNANSTFCAQAETGTSLIYPDNLGAGERPGIRFRYRFSPDTSALSELRPFSQRSRFIDDPKKLLPVDGMGQRLVGWQTATVCGEVNDAGRPTDFQLSFFPDGCDGVLVDEVVEIDHIEVLAVPETECL